MPKKSKEDLVALTVWIPRSLKEAANELAQEYGDVTRMVKNGLRKEIASKLEENQITKQLTENQEPKAS